MAPPFALVINRAVVFGTHTRRLGAPGHVIVRMLANVALDGIVRAVPDCRRRLRRSNRRNMRLLQEWAGARASEGHAGRAPGVRYVFMNCTALFLIMRP